MPHKILDNNLREYQFDLFVASTGIDEEIKQQTKAQKGVRRNGK